MHCNQHLLAIMSQHSVKHDVCEKSVRCTESKLLAVIQTQKNYVLLQLGANRQSGDTVFLKNVLEIKSRTCRYTMSKQPSSHRKNATNVYHRE